LALIAFHVPSPGRNFVLASAATSIADTILTVAQEWQLGKMGAALWWPRCTSVDHSQKSLQPELKQPQGRDHPYDIISLTVPPMRLSPGSFFYLRSGWRFSSGPLQIMWYSETDGEDIEHAKYLEKDNISRRKKVFGGDADESINSAFSNRNCVFFLVKRRSSNRPFTLIDRPIRLEGPYMRRHSFKLGESGDVVWIFAAEEGIILALSHVKDLWTKGLRLKLNWYTVNATLLDQIYQFYIANVERYIPRLDTKWVFSPAKNQEFREPKELYFEIRKDFSCERDVAEASRSFRRLHVVGK
jgi:hypothetical protein